MGDMTRRGFLKAVGAIAGAIALPALPAAAPVQPLLEWQYMLFDLNHNIAVAANYALPDGSVARYAYWAKLPACETSGRVEEAIRKYPNVVRECERIITDWAECKRAEWAT